MLGAVVSGLLGVMAAVDASVIIYTDAIPHTIAEEYRDMPASFGPDLPLEGLRGLVVPGEPSDGCSALQPPPAGVDNFTNKWIALVARYGCNFDIKVRNAQAAGYHCAIVYNVNSSDLTTMSSEDAADIQIPSVFVGDFAGLMLSEEYNYNSSYYVLVNGDIPFNINTQLILPFVVVVALCLLVIIIFLIMKCIRERRRARRHRLPARALKKIPTCRYSKGDPYDTCAICLDDYLPGDTLRVLPCAHAYHAACIDQWLTKNRRVCPVCKRRVVLAGERRAPASDESDTEPLLPAATQRITDNGTFVQQPAPRRLLQRLRRDLADRMRQMQRTDEADDSSEDDVTSDSAALLPAAAAPAAPAVVVPARETRRQRRRRRPRSAAPAARDSAESAAPIPAPVVDTNPHATGEIGVAALPVAPHSSSIPRHINL